MEPYPYFDYVHAPLPIHLQPSSVHTFPTPSGILNDLNDLAPDLDSYRFKKQLPHSTSEYKNETSRKALRRAITQRVGFVPTDIETITSHEKKRQYLECLEYYVSYLHQQLNIIGVHPVRMRRTRPVQGCGMSSHSIRTLLVHMANANQKLHQKTLAEEQKFIYLRDNVSLQSDFVDPLPSTQQVDKSATAMGMFR